MAPLVPLPSNEGGRQVTSNPNTALHIVIEGTPLGTREGPLTRTKRPQEVTSQGHGRAWPGAQGKLRAGLGSEEGASDVERGGPGAPAAIQTPDDGCWEVHIPERSRRGEEGEAREREEAGMTHRCPAGTAKWMVASS